jgi:nucleoside-diphosphate-sugar epimerase
MGTNGNIKTVYITGGDGYVGTGPVPGLFAAKDDPRGLTSAFDGGVIPNPMADIRHHNLKTMQSVNLP